MTGALGLLAPLAWRNLWRNSSRTAITLIVVAAGLYSILCFAALLDAWARSSRDATLSLMIGSGQIHAAGYLDNPSIGRRMRPPGPRLVASLSSPAVSAWSERLRVPAVAQSEYKLLPITLVGVDPGVESKVSSVPTRIAQGRYLLSRCDEGIVLGRHLAERLHTRLGRRVVVMSQAASGALAERSFQVAGIFAGNTEVEDEFAFTGLQTSQAMLGVGDDLTEISFAVPHEADLPGVIAGLHQAAPELDTRAWTSLSPMAAAMNSFMHAFVYIWLWIMFVLIAIGIVNTQLMATHERVREFGLLQALGMRPRQILLEVTIEAVMLVGAGVALGAAASALTIGALHGGVDLGPLAQGAEFFGAGRVLRPSLDAGQFAELSAIVWGLGVLVAIWPASRAAAASPSLAMTQTF